MWAESDPPVPPPVQELHKDKKKAEKDWEDDEAVRVGRAPPGVG